MYTSNTTRNRHVLQPTPQLRKSHITPFLKKMSDLLKDNRVSMDELAKTPLTKDDLLTNVIVTPL